MKTLRFLALIMLISVAISCDQKAENKTENKEIVAAKMESVSLHVSGMTCEIGCAKTIQSKLSKKDGVSQVKVVFTDSIATVDFDANKVSKEELITFIDDIAGGDLYKASEIEVKK